MAGATRWHAYVRIEKNGRFAEYNDTIDVIGMTKPTERDVIEQVTSMIIDHSPHLKGGRIVAARATLK